MARVVGFLRHSAQRSRLLFASVPAACSVHQGGSTRGWIHASPLAIGYAARRPLATDAAASAAAARAVEGAAAGGDAAADSRDESLKGTWETDQTSLFCDFWWPTVSDRVHRRLAERAQGLPEDPAAQGVLSWVEYELARGSAAPTAPTRAPKVGAAGAKEDTDAEANSSLPQLPNDKPPEPLTIEGDWQWLLRGRGEIVGPRGDRRQD
mmetsp:Transcript_73321/g.237455  ORF Transcript_73321/g.237455 Transcript_73321/m.237455 type:complete len:209 (-) Transcript_73321:39-665(-)